MHLFDVWEHEDFALLTVCQLLIEAESLHDVDLLCLAAVLLIVFTRRLTLGIAAALVYLQDLLLAFFDFFEQNVTEGSQSVLIRRSRGVLEPRHVHRVTSEALTVNAVIVQYVSIVAVIMPAFEILFVLKVRFELHQHVLAVREIVNEKARSVSEVDIGADEAGSTDTDAVADWSLLFGINPDCLSVPGVHTIRVLLEDLNDSLRVLTRSDNSRAWQTQL